VTGSKLALKESAAYPAKFGIVVINDWMSSCKVNQSVEGPRTTSRGPWSTGHQKSKAKMSSTKKREHDDAETSAAKKHKTEEVLMYWLCFCLLVCCVVCVHWWPFFTEGAHEQPCGAKPR
jgi:hypothetical protein